MPEPTCSIALSELQGEVGDFLGHGRGVDYDDVEWSVEQSRAIRSCLASGLHKFYFPVVLPGERVAHEWSFLKPVTTLTLLADAASLELPPDFGGLSGELVLATPAARRALPIPVIGVGMLDRKRAETTSATGIPQYAAIEPLKQTGNQGQRFQLSFWPTADATYTLRVGYTVAPNVLTPTHPYPLGGPVHRETVLESCLAVAEGRRDDKLTTHKMLFMEQLIASVSHDRKYRPQMLGYNGDKRENPRAYQYDSRLVTNDGLYS